METREEKTDRDALREREKELDALYHIAELCARSDLRPRELLREAAAALTEAFQMPENVRVLIAYGGMPDSSVPPGGAPGTGECLRAAIPGPKGAPEARAGEISAYYEGRRPEPAEFLERERLLLESTGKLLGETLRRLRAERRIRRQNTALREVVIQVEGERKRLLRKTRLFIEGKALPLVRRMATGDEETGRIAARHLEEVLESLPGSVDLDTRLAGFRLSARELELCGLIRGGMSSKEIASFLGLSELTVERHRHNIRRKLGVDKDQNLAVFLMNQ
jgi:DNA-binding CsgD family transcriptional regulator